jgi:hypothetical protein
MTSPFIPFWPGIVALTAFALPTQVFHQSDSSKPIYSCTYILYECDFSWNINKRRRMTLCTNSTNQTELAITDPYRYRSNNLWVCQRTSRLGVVLLALIITGKRESIRTSRHEHKSGTCFFEPLFRPQSSTHGSLREEHQFVLLPHCDTKFL